MNNITYSIAKSGKELKEAIRLVFREYAKDGYVDNSKRSSEIKISHYLQLPSSTTFLAKSNQKIIGTVSVVADSKSGLPMDEIYKEELDVLRRSGKILAEVSQLAVNRKVFLNLKMKSQGQSNKLFIIFPLFKLVFHYCLYKKFNNLCVAVNPKHNNFYKNLFFEDIGGLKYYPSVNDAPAIAKALDINKIRAGKINNFLYSQIINDPPDYKIFKKALVY